jgi:hypothetical protein
MRAVVEPCTALVDAMVDGRLEGIVLKVVARRTAAVHASAGRR